MVVLLLNLSLIIKIYNTMSHVHDEKDARIRCMHECMGIAKVVLKAATVAALFCAVKEIHRIHRAIEAYKK